MRLARLVSALAGLAFAGVANGLGATDTITWGGDNSRTGYQTNHNLDPAVVGSDQFAQLWRTTLPGKYMGQTEKAFSQPLVYTPSGGDTQFVYYSTTQNNVYKINAKTGDIVLTRNLHIPFLTADLNNCLDINPHVGIISTGVIDPDTDTLYLTAKTYVDQSLKETAQGRPAGRYFIHALDAKTLEERPGFPIDLEGTVARNAEQRVFNAGILNQRPALLHLGQYIYLGFGSHCVQYDFAGWLIGIDKTTGKIVERYSMQGADVPLTKKGASIWMSGGGIASDGAGSIFFATGNGYASQLADIPVKGFEPPTALEEAAVHMTVKEDGSVQIVDFFMPYEKQKLDGEDKDLGTSPLQILPSQFSCGSVRRIGVVTGKSGKTYWLDLDNLGGYKNGEGRLDKVIQVYQNENSVYAGAGVYPLEGGYVYINVIQFQSHAFKFNCVDGVPSFAKVADSPQKNAYVLGVSHGTVTSLDGQPGTGLLWTTDVQVTAGDTPQSTIRIYDAIPKNGEMVLRKSFFVSGIIKFTRAVFGDGILYVGTNQGYLYAFGAPTKSPLDCGTASTPVDFGSVDIGAKSDDKTITCKALIALSVTGVEVDTAENFALSSVPATPFQLAVGQTFSIKAGFSPATVGSLSDSVLFNTTNSAAGYRIQSSVRLTGTGSSADALLSITPNAVAFTGVVSGPEPNGLSESVILTNEGNAALTVDAVRVSTAGASGPFEDVPLTAVAVSKFTVLNVPSTIPALGRAVLSVRFDSTTSGTFSGWVKIVSNGGERTFAITGSAGPAPVALLEFQTPDGSGWVPYVPDMPFDMGQVTENTYRSLLFRVTNNAPTGGVRLSLTVSKPPVGTNSIVRAANQVDLAEGTILAPGESATAVMTCTVPKAQWNTDPYEGNTTWTMNTNDPVLGKQVIPFSCHAVAEQAPPLVAATGLGKYRYVGCFKENTPGRQLSNQVYGDDTSTNAKCISACSDKGNIFCGTQYHRECWRGDLVPSTKVADSNCNFYCSGDINQICGGNGVGDGAGGAYISLFADTTRWDGNLTRPTTGGNTGGGTTPVGGPSYNPGVNGYKHIGCYTESTTGRALPTQGTVTTRTVANCVTACKGLGKKYAGVEYGGECWCGDAFSAGSVPAPLEQCNIACTGNATEWCGGGSRLNVYQNEDTIVVPSSLPVSLPPASSTVAVSSVASSVGASSDVPASSSVAASSDIPVASSAAASSDIPASSSVAVSSDIPVSSDLPASSTADLPPSSIASSAAPTATGPTVRDKVGNWSFQGCFTENKAGGGRALELKSFVDPMMTLDLCANFCDGFERFGVEYGIECYCGNELQGDSVLAQEQSDCSFVCPGDQLTYCGAGDRLQVYKADAADPTSAAPSSAPSGVPSSVESSSAASSAPPGVTTTTSSAAPTSTAPAVRQTVLDFTFQGCYTETNNGGRALSTKTFADDNMTLEVCAAFCTGSTYFGVEYGRECYCGETLREGSVKADNQADCSFLCPGDKTTYCGAGSRLQLYKKGTTSSSSAAPSSSAAASSTIVPSAPAPVTVATTTTTSAQPTSTAPSVRQLVSNKWAFQGCYTEASSGRALGKRTFADDTMTLERCATYCDDSVFFGVEYGRECYCGDKLKDETVKLADLKECSFLCPGDKTTYCGAGVRLQLYKVVEAGASSAAASSTSAAVSSVQTSTSPASSSAVVSSSTSPASSAPVSSAPASSVPVSSVASSAAASSAVSSVPASSAPAFSSASSAPISSAAASSTASSAPISSASSSAPASSSTIISSSAPPSSTAASSTASASKTSTSSAVPSPTGPIIWPGNTNFTYYACVSEPSKGRLLPKQIFNDGVNMTTKACAERCWEYDWAGVEYGRECWCGNALNLAGSTGATPGKNVTDSECKSLCPGDNKAYCGAGSRMSLYMSRDLLTV